MATFSIVAPRLCKCHRTRPPESRSGYSAPVCTMIGCTDEGEVLDLGAIGSRPSGDNLAGNMMRIDDEHEQI